MRFRRYLLCCLLFSAGIASSSTFVEQPASAATPGEMSGSVVQRDAGGVSAASVDLTDYAAGRSIVTYTGDVRDVLATTDSLAAQLGFEPTHIYTARIRGFAAKLDDRQVAALKKRSDVAAVESDEIVPAPRAYGMPTGVERIGALANSTAKINGVDQRVNADVAVIDSGADFDNTDLDIEGWADCTSDTGTGWDEIGHGTHVAGTIAALDNGSGVTGVAPGARIWSIKIFVPEGGLESWAICGLEIATDYGSTIDVANLSWGWYETGADGPCSETLIHQAICDAYNAGITLVNAAGNEDRDASNSVPTTYSQVIAVSALADSDGQIGGKGVSTDYGCDDCFATFSNYGADIDLAAPGVDILSLCPTYLDCNAGSGLAVESGTSMSSPHVAGAAALYIARNGRVGPAAVRSALIANSDQGALSGDPDGIHERVLYAGILNPSCSVDPSAGSPGSTAETTCSGFRASETVTLYWDVSGGTKVGSLTASARGNASGSFTIPSATRGLHDVIAKGKTSRRSAEDTLRIQGTMALSPSSGASGASVLVSIAGFGGGEVVTVRFDPGRSSEATIKTNVIAGSTGSKTFTVVIPVSATVGTHKTEAKGDAGSKVTRTFVVTSSSASVNSAETTATATPTLTPTATATELPIETATTEITATAEPSPTDTPTAEPSVEPTVEIPSGTPEGTAAG